MRQITRIAIFTVFVAVLAGYIVGAVMFMAFLGDCIPHIVKGLGY
jgi:hypothetical protein